MPPGAAFASQACLAAFLLSQYVRLQVLKVIPYSATQLYAYESFKLLFASKGKSIGVAGRLAAGASAGMTATLVSHPLFAGMQSLQASLQGMLIYFASSLVSVADSGNSLWATCDSGPPKDRH